MFYSVALTSYNQTKCAAVPGVDQALCGIEALALNEAMPH